MAARPIDIARKLKISTTTLRTYEVLGLVPPVPRSPSGYRLYTDEHIAYFVCIREMLAGFSLTLIARMLQAVMTNNIAAALWMANETQAELHQEKLIAEKIALNLLHKDDAPTTRERLTIHEVSRATGVPMTTIRYWDRVGLISAERSADNRYRLFTAQHVRQILTIYALKLSSDPERYSIAEVKEGLKDVGDLSSIVRDIEGHLEQVNRDQIKGIAALYHLCVQVESSRFDKAEI